MVRRTKEQAQRTRASIVESALAEFADRGVRATTLEGVAERAGVTRGAVYWHFVDKQALVLAVVADLRWPLDIGSDFETYRLHPRPLSLLHENLRWAMERCMNSPGQRQRMLLVVDARSRAELGTDALARLDRVMSASEQGLERIAALAQRLGQLRAGLSPVTVARGLCIVAGATMLECRRETTPAHPWVAPPYLELFIHGICTAG